MASYSSSDLPKPKMGPVKRSPFQQAFREARAAGKKDFTFNGKKYSTELAKPKAESAPKAAEGSGRGASAGRTAADRDMGPGRPGPKTPAGPRRNMAAEAKGAETLERMKSRAERGMAVRSNEEMRDEAKGRTLGALSAAATLAGGPLARMAASRAAARRSAADAERASRIEPRMRRSGESVDAAMKQARMDMAREPRFEPARPVSAAERKAPTMQAEKAKASPRARTREADEGVEFKKGGSVKGGGCETRSKKARFI